jgi:hypothetical protein
MTTGTTTDTKPRSVFHRTRAVIVAATTAGALFATAAGAHAAVPASQPRTGVADTVAVDDPGFTPEEQERGAVIARGWPNWE